MCTYCIYIQCSLWMMWCEVARWNRLKKEKKKKREERNRLFSCLVSSARFIFKSSNDLAKQIFLNQEHLSTLFYSVLFYLEYSSPPLPPSPPSSPIALSLSIYLLTLLYFLLSSSFKNLKILEYREMWSCLLCEVEMRVSDWVSEERTCDFFEDEELRRENVWGGG